METIRADRPNSKQMEKIRNLLPLGAQFKDATLVNDRIRLLYTYGGREWITVLKTGTWTPRPDKR